VEAELKPRRRELKALFTYLPLETVVEEVEKLGFIEVASATVISDAKFWERRVFKNGSETVTVLEEIGDADYLRDPMITICGSPRTVTELRKLI